MTQDSEKAPKELFTPTQRKLLELLKDGQPHKRDEVRRCIDELASFESLKVHLSHIRNKIRPYGYDIISQVLNRNFHYRVIRTVAQQPTQTKRATDSK